MKSANNIIISLGKPVTAPVLVPVVHKSTPACIDSPFMVNGECYRVTAMAFDTPHSAVFVDDIESIDVPKLGKALGTHALFPKGASIVFIQMMDKANLKARVWQYGKGEARFSYEAIGVAGTAAMMLQKTFEDKINVSMSGNIFTVHRNRNGGTINLSGPSELIGFDKGSA